MTRSIIFIVCFFVSSAAIAGPDIKTKILQISSSGLLVELEKGSKQKIAADDLGFIVKKVDIVDDKTVLKPVAKIKAIKVTEQRSVWKIQKVYLAKFIKRNEDVFLFSQTRMLEGRKDLSSKRKRVVAADLDDDIMDFLKEDESGLAKKTDEYDVIEETHAKDMHLDKDIELVDIDGYKETLDDNKYFRTGIYRSPYAKEFSNRRKIQTFEKMVVAYLNKFNDPDFNYSEFYLSNKKYRGGATTVYKKYIEKSDEELRLERKEYQRLKAKGEDWSKDYTDTQLSEILNNLSVITEKYRRRSLVTYKFDYQAYFSVGLNLINNENLKDSETTEQSKFDLELSTEGYFLQEYLDVTNVTFEFSGRRAKDAFFGGELNARSTEYSLAAHVNWYPFVRPNAIEVNIFYIGLLARLGISSLENLTTDETGTYQTIAIPALKAGMKYNFSTGYGFRVSGSYSSIRVERLAKSVDEGTLPDRTRYDEGKMSFSFSKFY